MPSQLCEITPNGNGDAVFIESTPFKLLLKLDKIKTEGEFVPLLGTASPLGDFHPFNSVSVMTVTPITFYLLDSDPSGTLNLVEQQDRLMYKIIFQPVALTGSDSKSPIRG